MTAAATRPNIVERLRKDGRLVEVMESLLGVRIAPDRTTAIRCLDSSHEDRNASAVIEPRNGRVTCRGCGRSWGLLDLAVLRGLASDLPGAARHLEERLYGVANARPPGAATASRRRNPHSSRLNAEVSVPAPQDACEGNGPSGPATGEFPFVPEDVVASLNWKLVQHRGQRVLKAAIFDNDLKVCGIKVRGPRRRDGDHVAFLERCRTGRREKGLLRGEALRGLDPGRLVLVLAGETDLLAFQAAALREDVEALAVSPSNGEGQSFLDVAGAFEGQRVVIVYDADRAGRKGALDRAWEFRTNAEATAALALPFTEEQVASGMKDLRDWLAAGGSAGGLVELALQALEGEGLVVEETEQTVTSREPAASSTPPWQPFPVDALPSALSDLVSEGAAAIGCDPAYIALTVLSVTGAAIGNSRTIELKRGWREPSVLWTAIVGESGTHKSPAQDLALEPLRRRDEEAQREHEEDLKLWKAEKLRHEVQLTAWRREGGVGDPPPEPERPAAQRYIVVDVTTEAVAKLLSDNPRGLLLTRDELAGWLRSFDAYRGGLGGDSAFYLSTHGARPHTVDRKGGDRRTIFVPRAALSICGAVQPGTLAQCIGREHAEDGLLARLLLAHPPRTVSKWTTATVAERTKQRYAAAIDALLDLELVTDEAGLPAPVALVLDDAATKEWVALYDDFAERQANSVGDEASALAKLTGYAARFALLHCLVREPGATRIDAEAIRAATRLATWFADEILRVYAVLVESPEDAARRRLIEWIAARGGRVTARDLSRGPREYRGADIASAALDGLVLAGFGTWEKQPAGPRGGRPTRVFVLRQGAEEEVKRSPSGTLFPTDTSGGAGTETSPSSLESGGFRHQGGVVAPRIAGKGHSASEQDAAAPPGQPPVSGSPTAPVDVIDLATFNFGEDLGGATDPARIDGNLDLDRLLGTATRRTA